MNRLALLFHAQHAGATCVRHFSYMGVDLLEKWRLITGFALLFHAHHVGGSYARNLSYMGADFFEQWRFFTDADPTHGAVDYVDYETAVASGLINATADHVYMGADMRTRVHDAGRRSVRIESEATYNEGLFVIRLDHIPTGCGTWWAFWMYGGDAEHLWPAWGEYDIMEGFHEGFGRVMTSLHTTSGCNQSSITGVHWNRGQSKAADDCDINAAGQWQNQGCSQNGPAGSIGSDFNWQGGGTFAAEWDPEGLRATPGIRTWYWPTGAEPADLLEHRPDPDSWHAPYSNFSLAKGVCSPSHFVNMRLIFDLTFCGDLGSPTFPSLCHKLARRMSCEDFVRNHPEEMAEAYWSIRALDVYTFGRAGGRRPATNTSHPAPHPPAASRPPHHARQRDHPLLWALLLLGLFCSALSACACWNCQQALDSDNDDEDSDQFESEDTGLLLEPPTKNGLRFN